MPPVYSPLGNVKRQGLLCRSYISIERIPLLALCGLVSLRESDLMACTPSPDFQGLCFHGSSQIESTFLYSTGDCPGRRFVRSPPFSGPCLTFFYFYYSDDDNYLSLQ